MKARSLVQGHDSLTLVEVMVLYLLKYCGCCEHVHHLHRHLHYPYCWDAWSHHAVVVGLYH